MTNWTPEAITYLRKRLGLTQAQFAGALHCHPSTVALWEQGRRTPQGLYAAALSTLALPVADGIVSWECPHCEATTLAAPRPKSGEWTDRMVCATCGKRSRYSPARIDGQ